MKIVEKKCPNCGANLDFKVGERDVACEHCRRKFAVQYDGVDFTRLSEDAVKTLKNIDIVLAPSRRFVKIVIVFIVAFILMAVATMVFSFAEEKKSREEFEQNVQESQEEYERRTEEMERETQEWFERKTRNMGN